MENKGLLFIPDISGFTRFVTEMEIEHSRYIIQQLLEILVNANQADLTISEIEGDAILFYKFGEPLALEEIYKQVEKMFSEFHRYLNSYEHRRFCQCKACVSAIDLTLKVITHYGEFTSYNVKNFRKLIGKDVIVAHQLLKNDIEKHEYWLVTNNLLGDQPPADFAEWMNWKKSAKQTEQGEIPFHYTELTHLREDIKPEPPSQREMTDKAKVVSVSREYEVDIKLLFYTVVHFEFRNQWQVGVKAIDEVEHFLPGVGSRHRRVMDNGETMVYTSSFSYGEERIVFSETDDIRKRAMYYIIEKTGENKSRLTVEIYAKKNFISQLLFRIKEKKQAEADLEKSLSNLTGLLKEIELPVEF
jgi:hypothetical protein